MNRILDFKWISRLLSEKKVEKIRIEKRIALQQQQQREKREDPVDWVKQIYTENLFILSVRILRGGLKPDAKNWVFCDLLWFFIWTSSILCIIWYCNRMNGEGR